MLDWRNITSAIAEERPGAVKGQTIKYSGSGFIEAADRATEVFDYEVGYSATDNVKQWMEDQGVQFIDVIYTDTKDEAQSLIEGELEK